MKDLFKPIAFLCACVLFFTGTTALAANNIQPDGFIENRGQIVNQHQQANNDVLFLYTGKGVKIQLRRSGYSYELFRVNPVTTAYTGHCPGERAAAMTDNTQESYRVDVNFMGANSNPEIVKEQQSTDYLNYYLNGSEIRHVYAYYKVTYRNVYPNTDIEFILKDNDNNPLKYNIILHPGADLNAVRFIINGANAVTLQNNTLNLLTPYGTIQENIPFSYYADAPAVDEKVHFQLEGNMVSFATKHNHSRTFIIDPGSNLIWATYYGGTSLDYCTSTGVDAQNNVYMAGHTMSTANIATNGSFQSTIGGSLDAYLVKFDAAGVRQWGTYFGGGSFEQIFAMYIEPNGAIYLTGDTNSPSGVASASVQQTTYGGGIDDALLAKFDQNGLRLWSTYFGNYEHDISQAITMDGAGNVIISGHTQSTVGIATAGAYNTTHVFNMDVFIAKFSPAGMLLWATYYGDSNVDEAFGLACDASNNIYVTGWTGSISGIATPSGHQPNASGQLDGFLAKFNGAGTALAWGTYYGGLSNDKGTVLRVNAAGNVVLGGFTSSSVNIASAAAYQPSLASADDSFLATFSPTGTRLWGTYFGGNDVDYINAMIVDAKSNIIVGGQTMSTNSISTLGAFQPSLSTIYNYDAFIAKFSSSGNLKLGTYFGGPANDFGNGIAMDNTGKIYLAGETTSTIDIATTGAHQTINNGQGEGFLAKFCMTYEPSVTLAGNATVCIGTTNTVSALNSYSTYLWSNGSTVNPVVVTNTAQGIYYFSVFVTDGFGCDGFSDTVRISVANCYVSLPEEGPAGAFRLYPVPSGDQLTLELASGSKSPCRISIFSVSGQLVYSTETVESTTHMNIQQLPPGMYLLRANSEGSSSEKKFIKE